MYVKSKSDGICKICGKPTKFFGNVLGYGTLDVWTNKDIQKYKIAKKNKLNYIVLWNKKDIEQFIQNFTNYTA